MDAWGSGTTIGYNRGPSTLTNKWEGEDADEYVADSWDQDDEEEESPIVINELPKVNGLTGKKKLDRKGSPEIDSASSVSLPRNGDKLYFQKLQEEADLDLAKEVFGVDQEKVLSSEEDYSKLRSHICSIIESADKNNYFTSFAEEIILALSNNLQVLDLKKICVKLTNLQIQKTNVEKGEKKKNKGTKLKAKLKIEGHTDYNDYSAYTEDYI